MTHKADIAFYLSIFRYLGIFYAEYNPRKKSIHITKQNQKQAIVGLIFVLAVNISALGYFAANFDSFRIMKHNRTGDIYNIITFILNCLIISTIALYFYVNRQQHAHMLQELLQLNTKPNPVAFQSVRNPRRLRRMPSIYMILSLISWINHYRGFYNNDFRGSILIVSTIVFAMSFMYCGLILMMHIWIQRVLKSAFQCWNTRVFNMNFTRMAYADELQEILMERLKLLNLCQEQVNSLYGLIIIVIVAFILFTTPAGFFYFISVVLNMSFSENLKWLSGAVTTFFWNFSWVTVLIMMMMGNGVTAVVNDMNKALCKIPRNHCPIGVKRMVEKLLMKNLRQRPILTAHGFFAVDKSALFQLFTVVLTYMVILVQFKEMETSRYNEEAVTSTANVVNQL